MNGGLLYRNLFYFLTVFAALQLGAARLAFATISPNTSAGNCGDGTLGGVICNVVESAAETPGLLTGLSYLFGLVIGAWAIAKLYEHVQNPHQTSIWEFIKKAIVAGSLFALPIVIEAAYVTLTGTDNGAGEGLTVDGFTGKPTGGGLDAMVVALVGNTFNPMGELLIGFCYLAGIVLIIVGIMRLMKSSQEGARGPGGFGTIMTFLVAGALLSADEMMAAWSSSLFASDDVKVGAELQFDAGLEDQEREHVLSVISAVLGFVMILGWISFIRGFFIIREVAEGSSQASLMAGMTHLFGGALAINLGPVLNAVQETFGLSAIGVTFN